MFYYNIAFFPSIINESKILGKQLFPVCKFSLQKCENMILYMLFLFSSWQS